MTFLTQIINFLPNNGTGMAPHLNCTILVSINQDGYSTPKPYIYMEINLWLCSTRLARKTVSQNVKSSLPTVFNGWLVCVCVRRVAMRT